MKIPRHIQENETPNPAAALLRQSINAVAVLSLLMLLFYGLEGLLYGPADRLISMLAGADDELYNAVFDVYDMFVYTVGFFAPLGITLLLFRGSSFRPDISFAPQLPPHAISAIFATIGILYVFGTITDQIMTVGEAIGIPFAWYDQPIPETPGRIVLYFLSSVILPALVEEMVFRGYILHLLLPYGRTFAILVSAVLFGVMHLYLPQMLYATAAGVMIGYFVVRSGSMWIGILIHMTNNLLSFVSDMAYQFLSEDGYTLYTIILYGAVYLAATVSVVFILHSLSAPGRSSEHFASAAVYNRLMTTEDAFRGFLPIPLLAYLICAA
ncbi:MAG: CPBP family intramembrane metalloprotease, partial [Clostridia bacterium]|nr:CPBP family intramembrane metalloprotease [Clostridia bacterium]